MEQLNMDPGYHEYDNYPEISRDQGSAFRTKIFGFDKDDVLSYIDKLVQDVAEQKQSFEDAHYRLSEQNRDLSERVSRYEKQMYAIRQELDDEKQYNQNAREREDLFRKAVNVLQEKVAFLQSNSQNQDKDLGSEGATSRRDEIVQRLREELYRKDESISKMDAEIARRDDIILSQDKMLSLKDNQLEYYMRALDDTNQKLAMQTEKATRMSDQVISLKKQIVSLETRLEEESNSFKITKTRNSPYSSSQDYMYNNYSPRKYEKKRTGDFQERYQSDDPAFTNNKNRYSNIPDESRLAQQKYERERFSDRYSDTSYDMYVADIYKGETYDYPMQSDLRMRGQYNQNEGNIPKPIRVVENDDQWSYQTSYRNGIPLVKEIYDDSQVY